MALEKTGYKPAIQGTTKVNVQVDADGYLAPAGVSGTGTKRLSINKVAAENSLEDNTEVLKFFLDLANGNQDSLSNQMNVSWGV